MRLEVTSVQSREQGPSQNQIRRPVVAQPVRRRVERREDFVGEITGIGMGGATIERRGSDAELRLPERVMAKRELARARSPGATPWRGGGGGDIAYTGNRMIPPRRVVHVGGGHPSGLGDNPTLMVSPGIHF